MTTSYMHATEESPELKAQKLISNKRQFEAEALDKERDSNWIKQSFMILSGAVTEEEKINRTFTSAHFKFQDSSAGGHYVINPRPQFTKYADFPVKGFLAQRTDLSVSANSHQTGMGHYYSEALDDTAQVIHMRFGVPQFNSMLTFFTGFFDNRAATMARTGRLDQGFFRSLGSLLGMVTYLVTWPLVLASFVGNALRFAFNKPSSSFYYFKPTMPTYWLAVNNMVNQIAIRRGLFPDELESSSSQFMGNNYKIDQAAMDDMALMMPTIFSDTGGIDVVSLSGRGQRMKNALDKRLNEEFDASTDGTISDGTQTVSGFVAKFSLDKANTNPGDRGTLANLLNKWLTAPTNNWTDKEKSVDFERSLKVNPDGTKAPEPSGWGDYLASEYDDGAAFATFRVNSTGPVQESFTNNIVDNDLANKFNSTVASNKALSFATAGGNMIGGNVVGDVLQGTIGAIKGMVEGALDSLNIGGLMALAGKAFTIIPKNWENSIANLPKANYTINLMSPYGNPISQMTNIYIPLCMLLAGALPMMTGKQSYTSPFIVQLYDRGRQQTRLGIIDSLSIDRGTSNLGFNKHGDAMRIDVTFSVADLSPIMAMPIANKTFLEAIGSAIVPTDLFDDESIYQDYINILGSVGLYDQMYTSAKFRLRSAQKTRQMEQMFSKARVAQFIRDQVGILDILFKGAQRDGTTNLRSGLFGDIPIY